MRPHFNQWLGMLASTCYPKLCGKLISEDHGPGSQGVKTESLPKKKQQQKKCWWSGSSGTAPTWQTRGPAFNPQYFKKKSKIIQVI
jgi:hypothetical protein